MGAKGPFYGLWRTYSPGLASPLRVATGGNANWGSRARCRRSPAQENERREHLQCMRNVENRLKTRYHGTKCPFEGSFSYPLNSPKSQLPIPLLQPFGEGVATGTSMDLTSSLEPAFQSKSGRDILLKFRSMEIISY